MSPQRIPARAVFANEREFQDAVVQMAKLLRLLVYHTHDSRHSPAGFPDLVIVGREVLWVELKTEEGKVSVDQQRWARGLELAGARYELWRPSQWVSCHVRRSLFALRR